MNLTFQDLLYKCVTVYVDDILIFSKNLHEHLQHLRPVFERLHKEKFMAKQQKCEFGKTCIKYLGHVLENGTVSADPDKVSAMQTWPKPENIKEVQQFMGLTNYYAQYIRNFADIAAPLTSLMSPKQQLVWGAD